MTHIHILLLLVYLLPLFFMAFFGAMEDYEKGKPFYRENSSAGMRRLRLVLWPIAMFLP